MNLKKIKLGLLSSEELKFKNYKEFCNYCEIEIKKGRSRVLQMQKIESLILLEKQGQKLAIKDILVDEYNTIDVDNREDNIPYRNAVNALILHHLVTPESGIFGIDNGIIYLSPSRMFENLMLVNQNYRHAKNNKIKYSYLEDLPLDVIDEYFSRVNTSLCSQVESCLNTLKNKSLLKWYKSPTVCTVIKVKNISEDGVVTEEFEESIHKKATKPEVQAILRIERNLLSEYKCESKNEIIKIGKWHEFSDKRKKRMIAELKLAYMYDSYEVIFNEDHIIEEARAEYELHPELFQRYSLEINNGSMSKCLTLVEERVKKYPNPLRTHKDFLMYYKKITHNLMELGLFPIEYELSELKTKGKGKFKTLIDKKLVRFDCEDLF